MTSIVLSKLPSEKIYRKLVHDEKPQLFSNLKQLDGKEGFVIAPFIVSKSCPIVLLRNNQVCIREIDNYKSNDSNSAFSPEKNIVLTSDAFTPNYKEEISISWFFRAP